jgi:hypothetical protein
MFGGVIEYRPIGRFERGPQRFKRRLVEREIDAPNDLRRQRAGDFAGRVTAHPVGDEGEQAAFGFRIFFVGSDESDGVLVERTYAPHVGAHRAHHAP